MLAARRNLCYSVGYLSCFTEDPYKEAWDAVIHTFRYIAGTLDYGLLYTPGTLSILGFSENSDSDWASCINTSRSTGGYVFTLSGCATSWSSKHQTRCAKSSCNALGACEQRVHQGRGPRIRDSIGCLIHSFAVPLVVSVLEEEYRMVLAGGR